MRRSKPMRPTWSDFAADVPVDVLPRLREAIIGGGLLLVPRRHSEAVYHVAGGRAAFLGALYDPAAAWAAVDALDLAAAAIGD